ncbi:unnamed protein product [Vicia faba]|uniref:Reverse transcriptase zinc-binding domain-containing protein n=1 Tax=Vicia faba TaxID=3906 RepID=A0AAV0YVB8_VICFA|nr:unnamed protein product [Vicia faba]
MDSVPLEIATLDNLIRRGVIGVDSNLCVGECGKEESVAHLFFECPVFAGVWYEVCRWLNISSALHNDSLLHLKQFEGLLGRGRNVGLMAQRICLYVDVLPCRCISFGKEPQKSQVSEVVFRSVLARSSRNRRCLRLRFGPWIEYCELLVFWIFILDRSLYLVVLLWCCFWMYFGWEAGLVSRRVHGVPTVQLLSYIFIVSGVSGFGSSVWTGFFCYCLLILFSFPNLYEVVSLVLVFAFSVLIPF